MRELLEQYDALARARATRSGRAVVIRTYGSAPRQEGSVLLVAERRPDVGLGERRLRRGRRGRGSRGGAATGQRQRDPLRDQRRPGVVRRARLRRDDRRPRPAGGAGAGRRGRAGRARRRRPWSAVVTELPRGRPAAQFGPHEPGEGAAPEPPLVVRDDGSLQGSLGDPALDAALVAAARDALNRGSVDTSELGGRSFFIEAFPVRPRLVIVGAVEIARSLDAPRRRLGYEPSSSTRARRSRPGSGSPMPTGSSSAGPMRRSRRSTSVRTTPWRSCRTTQVRRAGDRRGVPPRRALRRRGRLAEDAGRSPRPGSGPRRSRRQSSPGCTGRSGWISAAARPRRRRWRSSPRSSRIDMAAPAGR